MLLIVDDEPDVLLVLSAFAAQALPHADVLTAASGRAAIAVLESHAVDAILCDYRMPDLDGVAVLQASLKLAPHAKRVLMTAFADSSLPQRAGEQVPLDGFVEKAVEPAALRRQLAVLMGTAATPADGR